MKTISHFHACLYYSVGWDRPLDPPSLCVGAFLKARCSPSGSVALALYKAGAPFGRRCQKGKRRRASERAERGGDTGRQEIQTQAEVRRGRGEGGRALLSV